MLAAVVEVQDVYSCYRCCIGVSMYWCIGVLVYRCIGVSMYWCIDVLVYRCTGVSMCGLLICWCTVNPNISADKIL